LPNCDSAKYPWCEHTPVWLHLILQFLSYLCLGHKCLHLQHRNGRMHGLGFAHFLSEYWRFICKFVLLN
jgi:hypothetical protein